MLDINEETAPIIVIIALAIFFVTGIMYALYYVNSNKRKAATKKTATKKTTTKKAPVKKTTTTKKKSTKKK